MHYSVCIEQVSIPSQRRYVRYWEDVLSFPRGINQGPPNVNLPKPWSRELRRIRLHDLVDTDTIFFVVSELQEVSPSQLVEFLEREWLYNLTWIWFSHTQNSFCNDYKKILIL